MPEARCCKSCCIIADASRQYAVVMPLCLDGTPHWVQVDWTLPPRSIREFFTNFTGLPAQHKLLARVKCNLYYFR